MERASNAAGAPALGSDRYAAPVIALPTPRAWPRPAGFALARRAAFHGLVVGGLAFLAYTFMVAAPRIGTVGFDAFAYWSVQLPHPYHIPVGELGSFTYSPPAAMLFHCARERALPGGSSCGSGQPCSSPLPSGSVGGAR